MEGTTSKQEVKAIDVDDLHLAALEIDEALQAIQYITDECDTAIRDINSKNLPYIAKVFLEGEMTQYVNMLQVILRDLSRNTNILLDGTEALCMAQVRAHDAG